MREQRDSGGDAAGHVRADIDSVGIAKQFVARAAYSALTDRHLADDDITPTIDVVLRGITPLKP